MTGDGPVATDTLSTLPDEASLFATPDVVAPTRRWLLMAAGAVGAAAVAAAGGDSEHRVGTPIESSLTESAGTRLPFAADGIEGAAAACTVPQMVAIVGPPGSRLVAQEVADPNRTASKWREMFATATFQTNQYDPVAFFGWNADKGFGGGDEAEPALYTAFEAYYDDGTNKTMEWYLHYMSADATTVPTFRPIAVTLGRDTNASKWARVHIDIGKDPAVRSQFAIRGFLGGAAGDVVTVDNENVIDYSPSTIFATNYGSHPVTMQSTATGTAALQFSERGTNRWQEVLYNGDTSLYTWDVVNGRAHVKYTAGATPTAALTEFSSAVRVIAGGVEVNSTTAGNSHVRMSIDGMLKWYLANFRGDANHYLWSAPNGRFHAKYVPGATNTAALTEFQSSLQVDGNVGFYGATPTTKRSATADAVDLATVITLANALKADLIAYGLKAAA